MPVCTEKARNSGPIFKLGQLYATKRTIKRFSNAHLTWRKRRHRIVVVEPRKEESDRPLTVGHWTPPPAAFIAKEVTSRDTQNTHDIRVTWSLDDAQECLDSTPTQKGNA